MVNPFSGSDYYPVYDSDSGECLLEGHFGIACAGKVELRAFSTGVVACCEAHEQEVFESGAH
jgi:hypothetical protein